MVALFGDRKREVVDEDHGYDELMEKLADLYREPNDFFIGVFETDLEQAIKAGVHEFGAPAKNIPPRHWLSSFFDTHAADIADIYVEYYREFVKTGNKNLAEDKASEEVLILLRGYLETNPLSPDLKPSTWAVKESDTMMIETAEMVSAIAVKFDPKGAKGGSSSSSKGKEVARMSQVSGGGGRGGSKKKTNLLRSLKAIYQALTGPSLYEGYGFRKRAQAKPMTSTTVRYPTGYKRMPTVERGPRGHYPSVSRPK